VEPLARIDYFDFDDPAFAAAYGINGMHGRADAQIAERLRLPGPGRPISYTG
jgi:hypothetical protein